MSHGPPGADTCEPNLTPLLDLVLQLLMFFMMCVNFVSEQVNESIKLPTSQAAKPAEKSDVENLFININANGEILVLDKTDPIPNVSMLRPYLRQKYEDAERAARLLNPDKPEVKTGIIIRADKDTTYKQVYEVLQACKTTGFRRLQIRSMTNAARE